MRNRIICMLSGIMLATALWAQNSISDINRIKRDKDYLYGEATLESKEAAVKLAYELLEVEIKNWATKKDSKISSVLASKVYEYADTILLQRHNMVRAFVFVKTSNLKAVKGKNLTVKVDQDKPLTKPIVEERTPQPAVKQPEITQPEVVKAPEVREPQPEISKSPADEVIEQLKGVNSFHKLESVIKPLKDEGKITDYGKYITMKEPAACYLIVYDQQGNIKALLGPGITSRRNLKTNLDDSEKNYHGCGAIWLKIKE